MAVQMNVRQAMRIKTLLAERRLSITKAAWLMGEAYGSVANTIYGHRRNLELQAKIAAFLGKTVEELFGASQRTTGEGACATQPCATGDEVSHG